MGKKHKKQMTKPFFWNRNSVFAAVSCPPIASYNVKAIEGAAALELPSCRDQSFFPSAAVSMLYHSTFILLLISSHDDVSFFLANIAAFWRQFQDF